MSETEVPIKENLQEINLVDEEEEYGEAVKTAFPYLSGVSGLYKWRLRLPISPGPIPVQPTISAVGESEEEEIDLEALLSTNEGDKPFADEREASIPILIRNEELRVDVDGRYPQMTASGKITNGWRQSSNWIARLRPYGRNRWLGWIWYKYPTSAAFPYTRVYIKAEPSFYSHQRKVTAIFFGGGAPKRVREYKYSSAYFHPVEFEFDYERGTSPNLSVDTHAHPNRPASMPRTANLYPELTYRRAGFRATRSRGTNAISSVNSGQNLTWSDGEMHDVMQAYWSRFDNRPQWALWTFWARQHDRGHGLGGIMFDDIGPNHRQGTSVFEESFISEPPAAGDPAPAAFVDRMQYWTLIHEMGHAFNLAHSWQKHLGTPWIPLVSNPEDRSFMNYPYYVNGGEPAFFSDFDYRFTDQELLFLRHAPGQFVQQGNADWFDNHGFETPEEEQQTGKEGGLVLEIGLNRSEPRFEFLEPVMLEVQIRNTSKEFKSIPAGLIKDADHVTVIIKKDGNPARQWHPYARYLEAAKVINLAPGDTHLDDLFISAGLNGWDLAEPGIYDIQVRIEVADEVLVSDRLRVLVEVPKSREEEIVAQDIFTEEAGRVMKFDGSQVLKTGIKAWEDLVARLPASKAANHALLTLALPKTRDYRCLDIKTAAEALYLDANVAFRTVKADAPEAEEMLTAALTQNPQGAADTLGYQDYVAYCDTCAKWREAEGDEKGTVAYTKARESVKLVHIHPYPHVKAAAK